MKSVTRRIIAISTSIVFDGMMIYTIVQLPDYREYALVALVAANCFISGYYFGAVKN